MRIDHDDGRSPYVTAFGRACQVDEDLIIPVEAGDLVTIKTYDGQDKEIFIKAVVSRTQHGWIVVEEAIVDDDGAFTGEFGPEKSYTTESVIAKDEDD